MKLDAPLFAALLPVLILPGCHAPEVSAPIVTSENAANPSALAGAVRVLETVLSFRRPGTETQVRALECDTRFDSRRGLAVERVVLDVTIFAPTNLEAASAFEELRVSVEDEARGTGRVVPASRERVLAALAALDFFPSPLELVSYSDRLRVEVWPGLRDPAEPATGEDVELAVDSLEHYVDERAARTDAVGTVRVRPAAVRTARGQELTLALRPEYDFQRFDLRQIGSFLASLENESPAVRLTRLTIERSQHEPDVHSTRGWTFEAELAARPAADG